MTLFLQNILNGLSAGSVYALVAVGVVLIYKSSQVLNFAHGTLATFATFVGFALVTAGVAFPLAIVIAIAFAFVLGAAVYRGLLDRAREGGTHSVIMVTIALFMVFEGLAGVIWGTDTKEFNHYFARQVSYELPGGLFISQHNVWINGVALGLIGGLALLFRYTRVGIAMRAVAQNEVAAQLMGVRVARLHALVWGLATALAAAAGVLVVPKMLLDPAMLFMVLLKAFAAAVLGGMTSVVGAILGAWILGVVETLAGAYVSTEFQATIAFVIIIVVLSIRPEGLLGEPEIRKV